ncbi:phenolic glucoside malonyltransferase 2 [Prunus yedoensis var. nudiflora]|uniref:Phenolic glucoside malonyltransferase 2 n=1 Tax=Prunus yedoensis var. nudiflora TaxID=2094558 RepID=A0A314Z5C9_PRUYE|nr:phenolic glucoside malonyltransferase 2 [Prunus yedoensis var. nudiflora]
MGLPVQTWRTVLIFVPEPPKPSYDRRAVKDPAGIEAIYLKEWLNAGGPNNTSLMSLGVKENFH